MQITLTQSEIEVGIKMYVASRGIQVDGRNMSCDFTATRKNNIGISVEVDLGEDTTFLPLQASSPAAEPSNVTVMPNRSGGVSARRTPTSKVNDDAVHVKQSEPKPEPVESEKPEAKKEEKEETEQPDPKPSTAAPGEKASTAGEDTPVPVDEPEPVKPEPEKAAPAETETKEEAAPAEEPKTEATSLFGSGGAKETKPATSNPFADTAETPEEAPKKRNSIFGN